MVTTAQCLNIYAQFGDLQRNRVLVFNRESAAALKGLRVAPLGAVVTHKVRIMTDYELDWPRDSHSFFKS